MPTIYIVMGNSGSGKDTVAALIQAQKPTAEIVKFAAPGKRALEFMLRVPEGLLDDRVVRSKVAPNCQGRTYLEVLIDFWKHRELVIGVELFTSQTMELVQDILDAKKDVIITDCRNLDEGQAIYDLVETEGYQLVVLWVYRPDNIPMSSDVNQVDIFDTLLEVSDDSYLIHNNGTIDKLADKVMEVL
jgi:hypothetical protein